MTDEPMEKTEPQTAEQLYSYHVETARIESNNGGRGFAQKRGAAAVGAVPRRAA